MKPKTLNRLFAAARNEMPPESPADFAAGVLRVVRREPPREAVTLPSVWAQLNALFPRVALAAAALIILCVAVDRGLTAAGLPDVANGAAAAAAQFTFDAEDL